MATILENIKQLFTVIDVSDKTPCPECYGSGMEDVFINCDCCGGRGYLED
ncbi:hypothetical protein [Shouchella clausii]|nr:hypothetical protein [Shouchella clausii]